MVLLELRELQSSTMLTLIGSVNEEFISKGESLFTGTTRFLEMVEVANELGVTRNLRFKICKH